MRKRASVEVESEFDLVFVFLYTFTFCITYSHCFVVLHCLSLHLFTNDSRVVDCTLFFASSILFWAFLLVNRSYFHSPALGFSPVYSTSQLELNPEYRRKPRSNRTDLFSPVFDFSQLFRNQVQFSDFNFSGFHESRSPANSWSSYESNERVDQA